VISTQRYLPRSTRRLEEPGAGVPDGGAKSINNNRHSTLDRAGKAPDTKRTNGVGFAWWGAFFIGISAGLVGLSGCVGVSDYRGTQIVPSHGTSITVSADWDDVDAAVAYAVRQAETAVLHEEPPEPGRRVYRIKSVGDEEGTLVASLEGTTAETDHSPTTIGLYAKIGAFGDPELERRLVRAMKRRLEQLKGVEWRWIGEEF